MTLGNYGDKSEKPLSNEERDQVKRMLMDPLSFPDEFKFWLDHQINQPKPQLRERWAVYDSEKFDALTSLGPDWSGQISGRCWTPLAPKVTKFVGGNVITYDGAIKIDTWSNTFDDKDKQWAPHGIEGATFTGWTRNQQVLRNKRFAASGVIGSEKVYMESRDGLTQVKIADKDDAPFTSINAYQVWGAPVATTTPTSEGRILIYAVGDTDAYFMYDIDLGTAVLFANFANALSSYAVQQGNNNITNLMLPVTNRERYNLGLIVYQDATYGSPELFDSTGASVFTCTGGGHGDWTQYYGKFSPNGRWFVYSGSTSDGPFFHSECWLVDLTTFTEVQLDPDPTLAIDTFDWSPNSDYIVFDGVGALGNGDVFIVSIPDGYIQKIVSAAGGQFVMLQWQGDTLCAFYDEPTFVLPRDLVEINPKDGTFSTLDTVGLDFSTNLDDVAGNGLTFVISPDGLYVAYTKVNHFDAFNNAVNDIIVTTTNGFAGS